MPYIADSIKKNKIDAFNNTLEEAVDDLIEHLCEGEEEGMSGVLNYTISRILNETMGEPRYKKLNMRIGVLECAKQELYRRVIAPYEDECIKKNGDIY